MPASDATLVQGVISGDQDAFGELYDRWAGLIRATCFDTTRDLDTAEELAQEVFFRALRNLRDLREPQKFASWLIGIARLVRREWRRDRQQERTRIGTLQATDLPEPADEAAPDDRLVFLRQALDGLPDRERLCLQAFYLQGMDAEQARAAVGLSRPTFYRVLASARQQLHQAMSRREISR
jgi:RNA polymerase sigma-70 factor, ECF subfamily